MTASEHRIKSTEKTFAILEELEQSDSAGVTELARQTDIPKSSVHKYLSTLRSLGFIIKDGTQYSLSFRCYQFGRNVREQCDIYRYARPRIDRLATRIGETISLVVEENGDAVYLYQACVEETPLSPVEEGGRMPVHVSTAGKAILSYRPTAAVETYLANAEVSPTMNVLDELDRIRDQRIIIERDGPDRGEYSAGLLQGHRHVVGYDQTDDSLHSIAVPIRDADDYAIAALEVSGSAPAMRGSRLEEDIATLLVEVGTELEADILD